MSYKLDFEKPIFDLEERIRELKEVTSSDELMDLSQEIKKLELKVNKLLDDTYAKLTVWDKVQLSRHPKRPHSIDYINLMIDDFHELSGDRYFGNDLSIITGLGKVDNKKVAIIAIEKGRKTQEKIERNFGMPNPEGYRKALRIAEMASRFQIPLLTFVDTPGAYPGLEAEQRGQAHAIAENLEKFFQLDCPIVSVIIGEGGSGGALGIAVADRVLMQEYSIYSVISPESCASILWNDPTRAKEAAESLQLSAQKALELEVIDEIIKEPKGGAHRDFNSASDLLKKVIISAFDRLDKKSPSTLKKERLKKFREMGNKTLKKEVMS